jgi:hypothetical protein
LRGPVTFGVDQQGDAADILRDANAALSGAQQQSAAQPPALHRSYRRPGGRAETPARRTVPVPFFASAGVRAYSSEAGLSVVETEDPRRRIDRERRRSILRRRFRGSAAQIFSHTG